jgi:hypothetical protein
MSLPLTNNNNNNNNEEPAEAMDDFDFKFNELHNRFISVRDRVQGLLLLQPQQEQEKVINRTNWRIIYACQ